MVIGIGLIVAMGVFGHLMTTKSTSISTTKGDALAVIKFQFVRRKRGIARTMLMTRRSLARRHEKSAESAGR